MRTLSLRRQLDFMFVHDAIRYITAATDWCSAVKEALFHLTASRPNMLRPDDVRETFRPSRECGSHAVGERTLRYIVLTHAMNPARDSTTVDYTTEGP